MRSNPRTIASEFELAPDAVHIWVIALDAPDKGSRRSLAHVAQTRILAEYLGVNPGSVQLEIGDYGKPRLPNNEVRFNLSHSGRVAMMAISRQLDVGIDVQEPHPTTSRPWFAQRVCTSRERQRLGASPQPDELLRLWARKEAVIKARGDVSYVSAGEIDVWDQEVDERWLCLDVETRPWAPDHRAAVAFPRAQVAVIVRGAWAPGAHESVAPGSR